MAVLRSELQNVQKIMVEDLGEKKEQQLCLLREENDKLRTELRERAEQEKAHNEAVAKLEEASEDLKEKFFSADASAESLKEELRQKQSNLDQMKQNLQETSRQLNDKVEQIECLRVEIQSLRSTSADALSSEQTRLSGMQVKIETLNSRLGSQDGKISDLTTELNTLQGHYNEQCEANDELRCQLSDSQGSLQEAARARTNL